MRINIVLLGPPGAGKGTLSTEIAKQTELGVMTTSSALKKKTADHSALSQKIKDLMASGQFVSDDIIFDVVSDALTDATYQYGVVFDGFPRTLPQAEFFKKNNQLIDLFVHLEMDDELIVERMQGRRVHMPSGRVYHIKNRPPKVEGLDDVTGEPLEQRSDDQEDIVRSRLQDYHRLTKPILDWALNEQQTNGVVKHMIKLDAAQPFTDVWHDFIKQVTGLLDL